MTLLNLSHVTHVTANLFENGNRDSKFKYSNSTKIHRIYTLSFENNEIES